MLFARFMAEMIDLANLTAEGLSLLSAYPGFVNPDGYGLMDLMQATFHHVQLVIMANLTEPTSTILFNMWNWPIM